MTALRQALELGPWRAFHVAALTVILGAYAWVRWADQHRHLWADFEVTWWLWHWFTGGALETTRSAKHEGHLPGYLARRAGLGLARTAAVAAAVAGEYLRSGAPAGRSLPTLAEVGVGGAAASAAFCIVVAHVAVKTAMQQRWKLPLHHAVHALAGWDITTRPGHYITIPRAREHGGDGVVVRCHRNFQPRTKNRDAVEEIVRAKLDLEGGDVSAGWVKAGRHMYLQLRPRLPIPELVAFADPAGRKAIEELSTPSRVLLGYTRGRREVYIDLAVDSPQILFSAATGGAKSATLVTIASQLMWHGAEVMVADYKRHSHRWLRDFPGVRYARDIPEIHRLLIELEAEGNRRNKRLDNIRLGQPEPHNTPIVLLLEELSTTMDYLRDHWRDIRSSDQPTTSPAITALKAILNMGRAVRIHVLAVAQRADAAAMGSGAMRENYTVRILARHSPQTWKMLVPECSFVPKSKVKGRVQMCIGDEATETQVIFITELEAQAWVADRRGMQPLEPDDDAVPAEPSDLGEGAGRAAGDAVEEPVTLWQASRDRGKGIVPLDYDALRTAARPDRAKGEFPEPVGHSGRGPLYDPSALRRFVSNRPQGRGSEANGVGRMEPRNEGEMAGDVPGENYPQGRRGRDADRDRFVAFIERAEADGCWLWGGALDKDGYPVFWAAGRSLGAHRFAYELWVASIPEGETVDHTCETPACVRPDHLQTVTASRNTQLRHERAAARRGAPQ